MKESYAVRPAREDSGRNDSSAEHGGLTGGGLAGEQALAIAGGANEAYPDFAPLYLVRGDLECKAGNSTEAIAFYRKGLELVAEPDLESRLLAALIGILPPGSDERATLSRAARCRQTATSSPRQPSRLFEP